MIVRDIKRDKGCYRLTFWGLASNILLSIMKFIGGLFGRSTALIADALHSAGDILTDLATIVGIHFSRKPPDNRHEYGHGKFETFAAFIVGIAVFATGGYLAYEGLQKTAIALAGQILEKPSYFTLIIAAFSIIVKEILYRVTIKGARDYNSRALEANAWHHRSDALSSIGALLGIAGAIVFGDKWVILDPIAAIIVSLFVMKAAIDIIKDVAEELLETSLCDETEEKIMKIVESIDGVKNPHGLRTRRIGPDFAIDIHIEVDPCITVQDGHYIASQAENALYSEYGNGTKVSIHVEPAGTCDYSEMESSKSHTDEE